jgi:hypothetical protein
MKNFLAGLFLFFLFLNAISVYGQSDSSFFINAKQPDRKRTHLINYSAAGLYGLGMTWLYSQWYVDYPKSRFHFFNDNSEWEQMDKFAHAFDAYTISKAVTNCYRWAGHNDKKSMLYGTGIAYLFQTTVEVFDGFSSEWGFSGGDVLANTGGAALYVGQEFLWKEQRAVLKFSFHQTKYSKFRENVLGKNLPENILKDYNGQTYWLCINPKSFFKNSNLPPWLSLAIGYGAEGMTGGKENALIVDGEVIPTFDRYRQFYLSIDIDLARIQTKSYFLNSLFRLINIIHLPAPTIELAGGKKPVFKALYF